MTKVYSYKIHQDGGKFTVKAISEAAQADDGLEAESRYEIETKLRQAIKERGTPNLAVNHSQITPTMSLFFAAPAGMGGPVAAAGGSGGGGGGAGAAAAAPEPEPEPEEEEEGMDFDLFD
uniref:Large subunit ribosomal protein LP1 n=1 Tax=Tetraselmis sp. GSL018 TaxID=582737 RepID=A0A061R658_9CHLO|mmetsp:Transcript_11118/g.26381  ORF Transcript_11118/g.26381 Transcript_11118/m.26381 type:complete len:120 (-) Transcript_11118:47-406(-)|eukprot:CAMPEP_0177601272 /NCGR_PEP_ID=MMETSP0419_2-20121207/14150_1 /TAXON_ID=582737 /ORGANISM="Tetraselmis sp., Strain GSL018" /LENGTH=119 /DNA_ID=CAMNT_0019094485 /DNA_START=86 /DNA_END=445 /DNA_ORIENTATION=+